MSKRVSAGLLLYRRRDDQLEVYLAHPGGPLFVLKEDGHWTIPKGHVEQEEEPLQAARREVAEEVGVDVRPDAPVIPLGVIVQKGGKHVHAWAVAMDFDDQRPFRSNEFEMEWPPRSGRVLRFPEIDRAAFFTLAQAKLKIKPTQIPFLDRLAANLNLPNA